MAVNVVGHGERKITDALAAHGAEVNYVYGAAFTSPWQEELARDLAGVTTLSAPKVFFCSGGSEANETAVKLARQYHVERGEPRRWKIISRWQGYHGNTLGMLSVSGRPSWRSIYDPYLFQSPHIDPPYCYRCPYGLDVPLVRGHVRGGSGADHKARGARDDRRVHRRAGDRHERDRGRAGSRVLLPDPRDLR